MVFFTDKPFMPPIATIRTQFKRDFFKALSEHPSGAPPISFSGIDFRLFQKATLEIEFKGEESFHKLKALFGHAHLAFKKNTQVRLELQMELQNDQPEITQLRLSFNPSLRIFNLAQGFEERGPGYGSYLIQKFKDQIAHAHLDAIQVDQDNRLELLGYISKGLLGKDPIKKHYKKETMPIVNLDFVKKQIEKALKKDQKPLKLPELLKHICKTFHEGDLTLLGTLNPCQVNLELEQLGVDIYTKTSQSQIALTGSVLLDPKGLVHLLIDPKSNLKTPILNTEIQAMGTLSQDSQQQLDIHGKVKLKGHLNSIVAKQKILRNALAAHLDDHTSFELHSQIQHKEKQLSLQNKLKVSGPLLLKTRHQQTVKIHNQLQLDAAYEQDHFEIKSLKTKHQIPLNSLPKITIGSLLEPLIPLKGHPQQVVHPKKTTSIHQEGTHSPAFLTHLENLTQCQTTHHNQVELLVDGIHSHPKRLELIESANKEILLQTFVFKNDHTGNETAEALIKAHQRGVSVYVIIDCIGSIESLKDATLENPIYKKLIDSGISIELHNHYVIDLLKELQKIIDQNPQLLKEDILNKPFSLSLLMALKKGFKQSNFSVAVELIQKILEINFCWHEKYLTIDGQKSIVGGMNIADEYLLGGTEKLIDFMGKKRPAWKDYDLYIDGDASQSIRDNFNTNWHRLTQKALPPLSPLPAQETSGITLQTIQHNPQYTKDHHTLNSILEALKCLKSGDKAYFENAYFFPTASLEPLQTALMAAAKRGVDVRILTNSIQSSDVPLLFESSFLSNKKLIKAGVRIYTQTGNRTLHSKIAVLGPALSVIGSWNMDNRSESLHSEDLFLLHDPNFAKTIQCHIEEDFKNAKELTLKDTKSSNAAHHLQRLGLSFMADLF